MAFRTAHGIDDKTYKDLYLGDYFVIQDGTYNETWMVAHFDYYEQKGETQAYTSKGVVLIPTGRCGITVMNNTSTTAGGYVASVAHTTTCPAIATALSVVLGSYLFSNKILLSNATDNNIASMAGAGYMGASIGWAWTATQCVLPTEPQIYGNLACSSSFNDVGVCNQKLAVFNFINEVKHYRYTFYLRNVVSSWQFGAANGQGHEFRSDSKNELSCRPIIYIV